MKISLMRHYRVNISFRSLLTKEQFINLVNKYDVSDIIIEDNIHKDINWDICYTSDLPRAYITAKNIYKKRIIKTPLLREVPILPTFKTDKKLHIIIWTIFGRLAWLIGHKSQIESYKQTKIRVNNFISKYIIEENTNYLIVSHGFIMLVLKKQLKKSGFKGSDFLRPIHGKLYELEKTV